MWTECQIIDENRETKYVKTKGMIAKKMVRELDIRFLRLDQFEAIVEMNRTKS